MKKPNLFLVAAILFLCATLRAEILFEGYYKVTQFKKHIGFLVLRHEVDDKNKKFKTTSFIKLGKNGFNLTETYQAVSDSELAPVSISYLAVGDNKTKTIEVKFNKTPTATKMTGHVVEDGKKIKIDEKIPKGVFLSSALYYLMLQSKDGLKTDAKFDYSAITEEGPVVLPGTVNVDKKMLTQGVLQLLKITNNFAGSEYTNLVTPRGEVISAATPATSIETELVKNKEEATEGVQLTKATLKKIFGKIPLGQINTFHKKAKVEDK